MVQTNYNNIVYLAPWLMLQCTLVNLIMSCVIKYFIKQNKPKQSENTRQPLGDLFSQSSSGRERLSNFPEVAWLMNKTHAFSIPKFLATVQLVIFTHHIDLISQLLIDFSLIPTSAYLSSQHLFPAPFLSSYSVT